MDSAALQLAHLVIRQDAGEDQAPPECATQNEYDGRMGVRISAIFVILVGSTLGKVKDCQKKLIVLIPRRCHVPNFRQTKSFKAGT